MNNKIVRISPNKTLIGRAVILDRYFSNIIFKAIFALIWMIGSLGAILVTRAFLGDQAPAFLNSFATNDQEGQFTGPVFGSAMAALGLFLSYLPFRSFYRQKIKYPKDHSLAEFKEFMAKGQECNLFDSFSFDLAKASFKLFKTAPERSSKDLALAILLSPDMNFILLRLGLAKESILPVIQEESSQITASAVIQSALDVAIAEGHHQIEVGDAFVALCSLDPACKKAITDLQLEPVDVANIVYWHTALIRRSLLGHRFLDPNFFQFTGGIGRDWAYGFTPLLQHFGHDLTESVQSRSFGLEIIGREKEIAEMEEALLRQNGGNVVLVGEAGIGRRTAALGLAKKMTEGKTDNRLAHRHLIEVDIETMLAGYQNLGDAAARLGELLSEVDRAGNSIVFIQNLHILFSSSGAGTINAAEVLVPYLDSAAIHIIGSTDVANYNQFIRTNSVINQRFTRVTVEESSPEETIRILEDVIPTIEYRTGSVVSYEAIKEAVVASDRFMLESSNPEKSINLIDGATAHATSQRGKTLILPKDVKSYLAAKFEIPSSEVAEGEKDRLLTLEKTMHQMVVGQDEAVKAIAAAMRRARAGVTDSTKPIGSFLFLGPTGVGKTETAKALAAAYFGAEERMIRFDMSEYQNREDIYRFIGSSQTGEQGALAVAIREHPFSLLLFDEIEKANRDILDLFLQVLDEGSLTDGFGKKVSFRNAIIICTSNAGSNLIREAIQTGVAYDKVKTSLVDYLQKENIYRPEFINRFTQVVAFSPLSESEIAQVAGLMLANLKEIVYKNRGVTLEVTPESVAILAKLGYDPKMGARPMARTIEEKIENLLAEKILAGEIKKGDTVRLGPEDIK